MIFASALLFFSSSIPFVKSVLASDLTLFYHSTQFNSNFLSSISKLTRNDNFFVLLKIKFIEFVGVKSARRETENTLTLITFFKIALLRFSFWTEQVRIDLVLISLQINKGKKPFMFWIRKTRLKIACEKKNINNQKHWTFVMIIL